MRVGKLSNEQLEQVVLSQLDHIRQDVLLRSGVGVDCGAIAFGEQACVLSVDPITAADAHAGSLAVHVSLNDVAAAGAEPVALLMVLLIPPKTEQEQLKNLVQEAQMAAHTAGVEIIGGHTEVTQAVTIPVISMTAIGKAPKNRLYSAAGAKAGDALILTKWAGLEGTSIILSDFSHLLGDISVSPDLVQMIQASLSVVPEGTIAAGLPISAMHDVTEGGVWGAAWEIAEASGIGVELYQEQIPLLDITKTVCSTLQLNPYQLISSGSLMIAAKDGDLVVEQLRCHGIQATQIGRFSEREKVWIENGERHFLPGPEADEIYRLVKQDCSGKA